MLAETKLEILSFEKHVNSTGSKTAIAKISIETRQLKMQKQSGTDTFHTLEHENSL